MTVLQNIFVQQIQYNGHKDASKAISVLQIVGLDTQQDKKARHLSIRYEAASCVSDCAIERS